MDPIIAAITSENVVLLKKLIQKHNPVFCANICVVLVHAVSTCEIQMLHTVLENLPSEHPINTLKRDNIFVVNQDENKILEMLQCLLPYFNVGSNSIKNLIPVIFKYCTKNFIIVTEFFIKNFYAKKYNNLYPIINKLEAAVEKPHYICIMLHDEIADLSHYTTREVIDGAAQSFFKLLLKDTRESMDLAVETFLALLDKNLQLLFVIYCRHVLRCDIARVYIPAIEAVLFDPSRGPKIEKLFFQLIYKSINDKKRETQALLFVDALIPFFRGISEDIPDYLERLLDPFQKELQQKRNYRQVFWPELNPKQNSVCSLAELCRTAIRGEVAQNVDSFKEIMDRIWSLNLPTTLKCFLLYIPDPSYMIDLSNV